MAASSSTMQFVHDYSNSSWKVGQSDGVCDVLVINAAMQLCDIACLTQRGAASRVFSTAACKLSRAPLARGLLHRTASKSLCLSAYIYVCVCVCVCVQEWLVPGLSPWHPERGPEALWAPTVLLYASIAAICCDVRHSAQMQMGRTSKGF